jgi:hypothetical protein
MVRSSTVCDQGLAQELKGVPPLAYDQGTLVVVPLSSGFARSD